MYYRARISPAFFMSSAVHCRFFRGGGCVGEGVASPPLRSNTTRRPLVVPTKAARPWDLEKRCRNELTASDSLERVAVFRSKSIEPSCSFFPPAVVVVL